MSVNPNQVDFYCASDVDDSESNKTDDCLILDLGDFVMFNFKVLLVLKPLLSMKTKEIFKSLDLYENILINDRANIHSTETKVESLTEL